MIVLIDKFKVIINKRLYSISRHNSNFLVTYVFLKSLTTVGAGVSIIAGVSSPSLSFLLGIISIVFLFARGNWRNPGPCERL